MDIEGVIALFIPYALFAAITIIVSLHAYFRLRTSTEFQKTVRAAIEQGQQLSPELLARLGETPTGRQADLRRGFIAIAIGLGIAAFGLLVGEGNARQPMLAIGVLPFLVGVAYLGLWKFAPRE